MRIPIAIFAALAFAAGATAQPPTGYHLVPGSLEPDRGPDGNTSSSTRPGG